MRERGSVPRVELGSERALARALSDRRRPRVFRHALPWAAEGWSFERLARLSPDASLDVTPTRGGHIVVDPEVGLRRARRPLAAHLDALRTQPDAGYLIASLDTLPPALRAAFPTPLPLRGAPWLTGKLWASAAGVVSALHFDLAHNLVVQLAGRKRFLLARRRQTPFLHPLGPLASIPNGSALDLERPDPQRFWGLNHAAFLEVTLEPGEVLFLPAGVWHHVKSVEPSLSVNYWWATGAHAWAVRAADALKRWRGVSA